MTLNRRTALGLIAAGATGAAFATKPLFAASKPEVFSTSEGAINGYDPVAYFTQNKPVKGKEALMATYKGATFHFSSAENKQKFEANPASFAPQYGGYCAWAVSKGYTAKTDPDAFTIYDGKLFLNYNLSVRARWDKDKPTNIKKANANWPKVLN